jgi:hypothetical protein
MVAAFTRVLRRVANRFSLPKDGNLMPVLRPFFILALALPLCGFAKKQVLTVRFHVESIGAPGGSFSQPFKFKNPPHDGNIETVPFASERNIKAIYPVENPDGSFGCAFKLDGSGTLALRTTSTERRGASIAVLMATKKGSHHVTDLIIDKPIGDGIIDVSSGISPGEMMMLRKEYPVLDASEKKK